MDPYQQALAAANPARVRAAVSSAAAGQLLTEITAAVELESLYDAGLLTVSEGDQMCMAEAVVVQAARDYEAAASAAEAAEADAMAAVGTPGAAEAAEAAAAARAAATAAHKRLMQAIEDAAGAAIVMRHGLITRHGGVQEAADAAGVMGERKFHGQAAR